MISQKMEHPAKIGRYAIVSELGRGAMGVVYDAVDPILERVVAIKTINMAVDPGEMDHYEKRFAVEARAAGGLNHPNIVTIYDIGRSGNLAYMAMEYLEGRELKDMIAGDELTTDRALEIAAQVADGLAYAHEHGVVHRDVKPANIMILRDGRVKITDFGIAHMRTSDVRTQTGYMLGSPRYLSPEQVTGKRCDARSDVFSLGVIIYEMVTRQAPFNGPDVHSLMYQIVNANPLPPSAINKTLPPMLDLIVAKALAKSPENRYASITELAIDLRRCSQQIASGTMVASGAPDAQAAAGDADGIESFPDTVPLPHADAIESTMPGEAPPARGLAKEFDSMAATMRLAAKTGAVRVGPGDAANADDESERRWGEATVMRAPPWSPRERRIFAGAVLGALGVGAVIVFA